MSREIKFRVWDDREKTYEDGWDYFISCDGQIYALKYGALVCMSGVDYLKVERSTCLKDKNGKEICDGDIVREFDLGNYLVEFREKYWKIGKDLLYLVSPNYVEVIGNIHENPELLRVE